MPTAISWTDETWNPTTGCSKVDGDCKHCYAEHLSLAFGRSAGPWTHQNAEKNVKLHPDRLDKPKKFKPGTRVFVNSMSDLFHELIPDRYALDVFNMMRSLPKLTFQVLTKRPWRAAKFGDRLRLDRAPGAHRLWLRGGLVAEGDRDFVLATDASLLPFANEGAEHDRLEPHVLPNVWIGTSIGSRKGLHRLEEVRQVKTAVRWLSIEPLTEDLGDLDFTGIDWIAVGGESGHGFRPMEHAWARRLRDQALEQKVAFFFKQSAAHRTEMGTSLIHEDGSRWRWQQMPGDFALPEMVEPPGSARP